MMLTKITLAALAVLLLFAQSQSQEIEGRRSLMKNGDIILQGLFPITNRDGRRCERIFGDGLMWSLAMVYAVEAINNSSFLQNITLGYKIDNTCFNIPLAMSNVIEIVAQYRPNTVCYSTPRDRCYSGYREKRTRLISAVIGPAISWISIPVASLLGLYDIPQISYASTSRILSDKTRYKSFLRTVPSDEYQAKAMADFVRHFGWNYVFLVASDDEYGKLGAAAFKTAARNLNVCIANDEYIPFNSDRAMEYVQNTLRNLKKIERAKVIIVFSYSQQGEILLKEAEKLNITDRTWITSDAWSSSATDFNVTKTMLQGIFTFSIHSKPVKRFSDYIKNLKIHHADQNPWLLKYMEQTLGCRRAPINRTSSSRQMSGNYRICDPHEKLPPGHSIRTEIIANVIDAVNATANALNNILSCSRAGKSQGCPNTSLPIPPAVLLKFVSTANFQGADDALVKFDANGDRTSSGYVIRNVQITPQHELSYVDVGYWAQIDKRTEFQVNSSLIQWSTGARPLSTCFRVCQPGERVVGQSECCWNCQRCEKGTVSSVAGSSGCTKCNETHYDNEQRTSCVPRQIVYLNFSSPAGISIFTVSVIGIVVTISIAAIFGKFRTTPVIAISGHFLLVFCFIIMFLSFVFPIGFVVHRPTHGSCGVVQSIHTILIMLYSAFLLTKTRAVNKALQSAVPRLASMRPGRTEMLIVGILVTLELALVVIMQGVSPSEPYYWNQEDDTRLLECTQSFSVARIIASATPLVLLVLATFLAFRERNYTENFNEPKFISFTTIALCILLIAFITSYRYVVGISRIIIVAFAIFIAAFTCIGCLFTPKLYIIFVRPERNRLTDPSVDDRYEQETADNSAHTSSSDCRSPDLRTAESKSIAKKRTDSLGEQTDMNVNHVINHGMDPSDHVTNVSDHVGSSAAAVNGRKRSRISTAMHLTFELSPVLESNEEVAPIASESHSNVGFSEERDDDEFGKNETNFELGTIQPRAFTVL